MQDVEEEEEVTRLLPWMFLALVIAASVIWFQEIRIERISARNKSLQADLVSIRAGIALTESLRKANAALDRMQNGIKEDLRNAKGYDDPLPADVLDILDRVRAH